MSVIFSYSASSKQKNISTGKELVPVPLKLYKGCRPRGKNEKNVLRRAWPGYLFQFVLMGDWAVLKRRSSSAGWFSGTLLAVAIPNKQPDWANRPRER